MIIPVMFKGKKIGKCKVGKWKNGTLKGKIILDDTSVIEFGCRKEMWINLILEDIK